MEGLFVRPGISQASLASSGSDRPIQLRHQIMMVTWVIRSLT
jgi:hypothetical protein